MSGHSEPKRDIWRRVTASYAKLLEITLVLSVAILVIPVTLQIISRYTALIPSYIWTEEIARFLFIWTIMIGAMVGVRESSHFEVDVWPDLSRRTEAVIGILARLGAGSGFCLCRHRVYPLCLVSHLGACRLAIVVDPCGLADNRAHVDRVPRPGSSLCP
jgi:hypothetical protein